MDLIFRALADPTRRSLLDALFIEDGQTLGALVARFDMTRIGVAKHLSLLEEAGLVVTRRDGREKHHFLNPVGIRQVHDRWVSKYTEPWAAGLLGLRDELEAPSMALTKVFEIYIRTSPERLWDAITDPEVRRRFHFGNTIASDWTEGSAYAVTHEGVDGPLVDGENLTIDPPRLLVQSFRAHWDDDAESAGTSRVTWEIEEIGDSCRLVVTHDQLPDDVSEAIHGGWPMVLSGLKTWLETGTELTTPGSLMYG
ncbi:ArsR family transcriptional regulator [Knoellia sinensis KCTC 19936]|uniref:ArsR family transcriptional regulator n=1 Tax=Knoellia sinensis KCTC 19936 TaxID=1385520 RepID=A0A0A0JA67_9MICO|nr:metalloregulator ArsR/SmtB family transcription factor [Knoellia sinensis]KGN32481.1 ArsR family transcriptional regulator [Knoellia sinensis KCTC 19936]